MQDTKQAAATKGGGRDMYALISPRCGAGSLWSPRLQVHSHFPVAEDQRKMVCNSFYLF
jgi:hypothetical protein